MALTDYKAEKISWWQRPTDADRERAKFAAMSIVQMLFLFFCFFPYLAPIHLPTDVQPYALILSLLVCALASLDNVPKEIWLLALAPATSIVVWLVDDQSFYGFRESLSFFSPLSIALATIVVLKEPSGRSALRHFIFIATYIWLFFGLLERLINPNLLVALIPHTSVDEGRGVAGLATEPSFYGVTCLFILLLNYLCNENNKSIFYLLLFQIFFLAQSSVTILLLLTFMFYRTLLFPTLRQISTIIFLAVSSMGLLSYVLPHFADLRVAALAINFVSHPTQLFQLDTSLNARVGHVVFSIIGFLDNRGLPHGFDHFTDFVLMRADSLNFTWLGGTPPHLKIMSGYGSLLFELGVFGLLTPLTVVILSLKYFRFNFRLGLLFALYISTIMFSAIQVSLPLFGVFLGWLGQMRRTKDESAPPVIQP